MAVISVNAHISSVDQSTYCKRDLVQTYYSKTCGSAVLNKKQKAALKNPADDCLVFRVAAYIGENPPCFLFKVISCKIKITDVYKVWCHKRSNALKEAAKKSVLTSDDILKNFCCPLSNDIPDCPVRAPNHCTYDMTVLREKLRGWGRKALPQGGPIFTIEEVSFDFGFANSILDRLNALAIAIPKDPTFKKFVNVKSLTASYKARCKNLEDRREKNAKAALKAAKSAMEEVKNSFSKSVNNEAKFAVEEVKSDPSELEKAQKKYASEVDGIRFAKERLRTVYVCTNGRIAKIFIKIFGWVGVKKTMVKVDCYISPLEKTKGCVVEY